MIGFNRRFSKHISLVKKQLSNSPVNIIILLILDLLMKIIGSMIYLKYQGGRIILGKASYIAD